GKYPHAVGIEQQAHHHPWVKRWGPTGFILIEGIETTQIQLGHRIQQKEDQIALRQLGLRAMSLLPVALVLPRPIGFPGALAHHWSPCGCVTKGSVTGRNHYRPSSVSQQLSTDKLALFRTAS